MIFKVIWSVAAIRKALAFTARLVSIWTGIFIALIEILAGVAAGNFPLLGAATFLGSERPVSRSFRGP